MKRCKDCEWYRSGFSWPCSRRAMGEWSANVEIKDQSIGLAPDCDTYVRKRWIGWLWLIALILIITLALLLGGCQSAGYCDMEYGIFDVNSNCVRY